MAIRWAIANGDNNQTSTWNDGSTLGLPTSADDVFTNGFTVNMVANATYISMNNSAFTPRLSNTAIPQMANNTSPSGIVNASSNATNAFAVFNRNYDYLTGTWASSTVNTGWVSYQFPTGKIIKRYAIWGGGSNANISSNSWHPRSWTFEGSNDGSSWTVLETVTNYSMPLQGNYISGVLPNTASYLYYRVNITNTQGGSHAPVVAEIEMTESTEVVGGAVGGSFNFNTAGVTANITGATPFGMSAQLITVSAASSNVTINVSNSFTIPNISANFINYSGNCNLYFSIPNIYMVGGSVSQRAINKTGAGTLYYTGNGYSATVPYSGTPTQYIIDDAAGNVVIVGGIYGHINGTGSPVLTSISAVRVSVGSLTITGDVYAPTSTAVGGNTVNFSGSSFTHTGNVIGGTSPAIVCTAAHSHVGNVTAGSVAAIQNTANINTSVTGVVTASASAVAISSTGASASVTIAGNIQNTNGRQAVYCQQLFISNVTTTQYRFFTAGGQDRTLYSADTLPNSPAAGNVRQGITYGAGGSLTGTLVVPSPSDVVSGVPTDNTVGTYATTPAAIATEIFTKLLSNSDFNTVGSFGKLIKDNVDASISSRLASASYTAPDNTSVSAIKAKTDNLPSDPASNTNVDAVAAEVWDYSTRGLTESPDVPTAEEISTQVWTDQPERLQNVATVESTGDQIAAL